MMPTTVDTNFIYGSAGEDNGEVSHIWPLYVIPAKAGT
jgi:hypothetical protein